MTVSVDELLNVAVTSLNSSPTPASADNTVITNQITNTGNGSDTFDLTANSAISGNAHDPALQLIAYDANGKGQHDVGTDVILAAGTPTQAMAPDTSLTVFVLTALPSTTTDGQTG